jgi:hypothetical protein
MDPNTAPYTLSSASPIHPKFPKIDDLEVLRIIKNNSIVFLT